MLASPFVRGSGLTYPINFTLAVKTRAGCSLARASPKRARTAVALLTFASPFWKGEGRVMVGSRSRIMPQTPHPNLLPSGQGRGGSKHSGHLHATSKRSLDARDLGHLSKMLLLLWILAVAARLILVNQPYVDHWSW